MDLPLMAEKALSKLEDQLNCSICLDTFKNPKLLQCPHIFCQQCLEGLVRRQPSITCPSCRQVTPIPANGVAGLPAALHIQHFQEVLKQHKEAKEEQAGKKNFCPKHDKREVDIYCESCGVLICWKCIKKGGEHYSHDYEEIDDALERFKAEVKASLEPLEMELATLEESFMRRQEKIANQRVTIEAKIHKSIKQLHEILDGRQADLITQLEQMIEDQLCSLADEKKHLESKKAEIAHLMN